MEGSEKKGDMQQAPIDKLCVMPNEEVMIAEIFVLECTAEDKITWTIQADREWLEWDNVDVDSTEKISS